MISMMLEPSNNTFSVIMLLDEPSLKVVELRLYAHKQNESTL
jgi:hypothetical protein